MAKVLRSNVKLDDEIIPAGTRMSSKVFPAALRKQLKETGFFVDEVVEDETEDELEEDAEASDGEEEATEGEAEDEEPEEDQDTEG